MLDRTVVLWDSAHPHQAHNTRNYPIHVAGGNHLGFKHGYLHEFIGEKKLPLANLFVSMLQAVGAPVESFANSTGEMPELRSASDRNQPDSQACEMTEDLSPSGLRRLPCSPTSIDGDHAACHIAGSRTRKINRGTLDLFQLTPSFQGRRPHDELICLFRFRNRNIHRR